MITGFLWKKGVGILKESKSLEELENFDRYFPPYNIGKNDYKITIIYSNSFADLHNLVKKETISINDLKEKIKQLENLIIGLE